MHELLIHIHQSSNHFIGPGSFLPAETPCRTCGNLCAKCVHRFGHRRLHPSRLTKTADKSSAEFTKEKTHTLEYTNTSSSIYPAENFTSLVLLFAITWSKLYQTCVKKENMSLINPWQIVYNVRLWRTAASVWAWHHWRRHMCLQSIYALHHLLVDF